MGSTEGNGGKNEKGCLYVSWSELWMGCEEEASVNFSLSMLVIWSWNMVLIYSTCFHHLGLTFSGTLVFLSQSQNNTNSRRIFLPTSLKLFALFSLTVFMPADGAAVTLQCSNNGASQHKLYWSPTDMCCTLKKQTKKKSGLVPEFSQMFVEISGDFLVFFLLGKKRKQSFLVGRAWGVLQLHSLVLLLLFPLAE